MTRAAIEIGLQTLPLLLLAGLLAGLTRTRVDGRWLAVSIVLILVHDVLITRLFWQVPWTAVEGGWNWLGKLLGLAATLAIAALPIFGWRRCGITLRQAAGSGPAWLLAGGLCLFALVQALIFDKPWDPNAVVFMFTLPGPEEETFYRGILLLALNDAFRDKRRIVGAEIGWGALLCSVQFGAVHAITFARADPGFDAEYFANTFLLGLAWVWMRERTGSFLAPALSHNFGNGIIRLL